LLDPLKTPAARLLVFLGSQVIWQSGNRAGDRHGYKRETVGKDHARPREHWQRNKIGSSRTCDHLIFFWFRTASPYDFMLMIWG
jgi:hypothetical protein